MKIGVALSGCDLGGLSAYHILKLLERAGFEIGMVSCCCLPAAGAVLHGCGVEEAAAERLLGAFLHKAGKGNLDSAISGLAGHVPVLSLAKNRALAIHSVHVADGRIVTFTNAYTLDTERLVTQPLLDPVDALIATIGRTDGTGTCRCGGYRLCDFSAWYGSPLYPLKMSGLARTVSISFLPAIPGTPYQVLARKSLLESDLSPVHVAIEFPPGIRRMAEYTEIAGAKFESCANSIYEFLASRKDAPGP